jgi:peptide deformylase
MEIIKVPHATLRKKALPVEAVDKKLAKFVLQLEETLNKTRNPKGVGLAAPQVNKSWRLFTIKAGEPLTLINPVISKHSKKQSFHEEEGEPFLEGCLSIPKLWGPVPRWEWVEVDFEFLLNGELKKTTKKFSDFEARVVQHEYDHLEGILFTDYALEYDLIVYQENEEGEKAIPVDPKILELF